MSAQAIIEIVAQAEEALRNMKTVNDALDALAERAKTATAALTALAIGKGLVDLAEKIIDVTKAAGQQAEQIEHLSQRLGISTQGMQEWTIALAEAKLGPEDLALGMRTLSQQIQASLDPASRAATTFERLGIVLQGTEAPADVIRVIAERIKLLPDGFEKSAAMTELFGRAGQRLIPLFNGGADAIDHSAEVAHRFGAVLTNEGVQALVATDAAFSRLTVAQDNFGNHVGAAFAPAVKWFTELKTEAYLLATQGFDLLVDAATKLTARFVGMAQVVGEVGALLFSLNVFSKEAWSLTLDHIKAIDAQTASITKAIDAEREQTRTTAQSVTAITSAAVAVRAQSLEQERLGEKIKIANEVLYRQQELLFGTKMMSEAIDLSGLFGQTITPAMMQQQQDAGDRIFRQSMLTRGLAISEFGKEAVETSERLSSLFNTAINPADSSAQEEIGLQMRTMFAERQRLEDQAAGEAKSRADALMALQSEIYQNEIGFIGSAQAARRVAFTQIDAEFDQQRLAQQRVYDAGTISAEVYQARLENLELTSQAKRMAVVREFPTFWEQQLQAIVSSNSFSLSSIISTWSSGLATAVVEHKKFSETVKAAWQSTQIAMLQAGINTLVQWGAQMALAALREIGLKQALEVTKTALFGTGEAARLVIAGGTDKAMEVLTIGSLASISAMAAAALAIAESVAQVVAGIAYAAAGILAATPFGQAAAGALIVATTGFELTTGAAILAAGAAIQTALGTAIVAGSVPALAEGGMVFSPTLALIGEAGPEMVVPLDKLSNLGGKEGRAQTIIIPLYLNGREIARATARHMPSAWRSEGAPA